MDGRGGSRRRKGDNRVGNWEVPLDPLEWQISQESANAIVAWLANTIGATTRGCFSRSFSYRCLCRTCLPSALNL
ncbi:hypothetical protein GLYMA_08G224900v4 [Glycine max]|uniref:Uncharacterized protein n=1 Tax=Glycine max TaxID=3847 RepID=A0A0R0IQY2_SOYBN|nr:hypothetical protein GYH30_022069 [Glycine max]KRH44678.1 hypothetical protein GLYMA_08G224900v4 [Glycine max]